MSAKIPARGTRVSMMASVRDFQPTPLTRGERRLYDERQEGTWHGLPVVRYKLKLSQEYEWFTTEEAENCDELLGDGSGPAGGCSGAMALRRLICAHYGLEPG